MFRRERAGNRILIARLRRSRTSRCASLTKFPCIYFHGSRCDATQRNAGKNRKEPGQQPRNTSSASNYVRSPEPWIATPIRRRASAADPAIERRASACHYHQPVPTLTTSTFSEHMPTFRSWLSFVKTMMTGRTARARHAKHLHCCPLRGDDDGRPGPRVPGREAPVAALVGVKMTPGATTAP